MKSEP